MDALCTIYLIVITVLLIYAASKHHENKSYKSRLTNLERYVFEYLNPSMDTIQRRQLEMEYKLREPRTPAQNAPVAEPIKKPVYQNFQMPQESVPEKSYFPPPPEQPGPTVQTAIPAQSYSQDNEAISMEVEFGSKWLQYIGLFIVMVTLLLLGAYAIRYITPLQENILMYLCAIGLLAFGEYLYRVKDSRLYGLGLVFGGLTALYISCASSHYIYEFIGFPAFILFVTIATIFTLLLGFKYDSNLMIFKGLTIAYVIIAIVKLDGSIAPLEYSILLPIITIVGCLVIFLRKNIELQLLAMGLSYVWVIISAQHLEEFIFISLFSVTAINMLLIIIMQHYKERFPDFVSFNESSQYPMLFISLGLSYATLFITTPIKIGTEAGDLIFHDGWISLIILLVLQFIFTAKMKFRESDVIISLVPFISVILMGMYTVDIDGSIYFYLAMIFFVIAMNYKPMLKGINLPLLCLMTVVLLVIGKALLRANEIDPASSLSYIFDWMLIFFTVIFSYLNIRHGKDTVVIDGSAYRISPVLLFLLPLCFITAPSLSIAFFLIPLILILAAYIRYDVLTFNISYIILTYFIFLKVSDITEYYEIFIVSALVLFFFALLHEVLDRKKMIAISSAGVSSIMFMAAIAFTFGDDIVTTLAWAGFGILSIAVGLKSNTYYFRWIGLASLLISILKAFAIDISVLSFEMRILSFAALGFALLIISYIYTRYRTKILESLGLRGNSNKGMGESYPPPPPPPSY